MATCHVLRYLFDLRPHNLLEVKRNIVVCMRS